jgi:hypothetical protein
MADTLFTPFVVTKESPVASVHGAALRAWGDFTPAEVDLFSLLDDTLLLHFLKLYKGGENILRTQPTMIYFQLIL